MNLSKAFDRISHDKLLSTLQSIDIVNKPYRRFEPSLKNRKQQVLIGNTLSDELIIYNGVP